MLLNLFNIILGIKYAEQLPSIPIEEFKEFAMDLFFDKPRKIEVHVVSELMKEEDEKLKGENKEDLHYIISEEDFKNTVALYPDYHSISRE